MERISGIPASSGIAIGPAFVLIQDEIVVEARSIEDPEAEWVRFEKAQTLASQQLEKIYEKAKLESGEEQADIFKAQIMMLNDPELTSSVKNLVEKERRNVESALLDTAEEFIEKLEALDDEYLSARAMDVRDITSRLIRIMMGVTESPKSELDAPSIIIAKDLTPSDTILLDKSFVLGFCTAEGGATSHTAILARGLGIPAVVGCGDGLMKLSTGTPIIVDGHAGEIIIDADKSALEKYQTRANQAMILKARAEKFALESAVTTDGHQVEIAANIGNVAGAKTALDAGAEGIGLLRSEFLFLERTTLPDEEEQYQAYKAIADIFGELPVILRTLDVGGDKKIPYINLPQEANPFMGVRGIRLCLAQPALFKPQLRAALRAGVGNNLKVMFPMVATVEEIHQIISILNECRNELTQEGQQFSDDMEIGIMIEIPAAAVMADQLAQFVDFFSIGTNDLGQYALAADRTNAHVAKIASSFQPSVFRLIKQVIDSAHTNGIWVGLCGELAGEPLAIPILLGLGLDEFSMNPPAIPIAKLLIRSISRADAKEVADEILNLNSIEAVRSHVIERIPAVSLE